MRACQYRQRVRRGCLLQVGSGVGCLHFHQQILCSKMKPGGGLNCFPSEGGNVFATADLRGSSAGTMICVLWAPGEARLGLRRVALGRRSRPQHGCVDLAQGLLAHRGRSSLKSGATRACFASHNVIRPILLPFSAVGCDKVRRNNCRQRLSMISTRLWKTLWKRRNKRW